MIVSPVNEWGLVIDSQEGVRPNANYGTSFTPGASNVYGSYTTLLSGAALTDDAYSLIVGVHSVGSTGTATDTLATIGLDPAGGTNFTDFITDLAVSAASSFVSAGVAGGIVYYFPVFIKAGTSIGIKASQNNASPTAANAYVRCMCQPSRPEMLRVGSRVITYGSDPSSSGGTVVTPGTSADGAWVQLGTVGSGDVPFFWNLGVTINNAAVPASAPMELDLGAGDGTNNKLLISQAFWFYNATEVVGMVAVGSYGRAAPGDGIYGRAQCGANVPTGLGLIAYGVV